MTTRSRPRLSKPPKPTVLCYCCTTPQPVAARWHDLNYCDGCGNDAVLVWRMPNGFLLCQSCSEEGVP